MRCDSCDRELPDDGIICPSCNDAQPEPAAGYKELRREARSLRGWIIISLVFGIFAAPFAIWRATRSLARFRGKAEEEDPISYHQLRVMRRLAVALLVLWVVLLAGQFGFSWGSGESTDALVQDAVLTDVLARCSCPDRTVGISVTGDTEEYLSRGRNVADRADVVVRLGTPHFYSEDKAAVAAQLSAPAPLPSFGANYELKREADGRWIVYHRAEAWKS
ncbi:MAG TPA: hypothetical protein VGF48_19030 [Thermoanaerobaculia bacterium]|jgi:hypothetical protein